MKVNHRPIFSACCSNIGRSLKRIITYSIPDPHLPTYTCVDITVALDLHYTLGFSTDFTVESRNGMIKTNSHLALSQYDVLATAGDNGIPQRFSE